MLILWCKGLSTCDWQQTNSNAVLEKMLNDHHNLLETFLVVSDLAKSTGVLGPVLFIFGSAAIILLAAKMR